MHIKIEETAEEAAKKAEKELESAIDNHKSFIFEAGPGAGKTYSLHNSLDYIIEKYGADIRNNHQKIGCISYTNTAVDEINERVGKNSLIVSKTIHGFCWDFMINYKKEIRKILSDDKDWGNIIADSEIEINKQEIVYETGNKRKITEREIYLKHDDIPVIFSKLCQYEKFRAILTKKYPFLFIDEYQDSNNLFVNSLIDVYENIRSSSIIGLFGDHWQSIYENNTCGKITDDRLTLINKEANFRSCIDIVDFLNKLRPELIQHPKKQEKGVIKVYHTNSWVGERRRGSQWKGELPEDERNKYFEIVKKQFYNDDVNESNSKILILTHKLLSSYQNYENILKSFSSGMDAVIENEYISFLKDLEDTIKYYENKEYAKVFQLNNNLKISSVEDKKLIKKELKNFKNVRCNKTIGEIIEHLKSCRMIILSPKIRELENKLTNYIDNKEEDDKYFEEILKLKKVQYAEIIPLKDYIDKLTPFSTQHNVKGEEYDNILAVFGRGWNKYNFNEMIEKLGAGSEDNNFIRSRNLFYVCVSRAIHNLTILFTEELSEPSLNSLKKMVGEDNVVDIVKESE